VSCEPECLQNLPYLLVIIAFAQAHPLWLLGGRHWTGDDQVLEGGAHQLHVMPIDAFYYQTDGNPLPLRKHAAFDAGLASAGGLGPRSPPPPAPPCSSPHPLPASSTRSPALHQIPPHPPATAGGTPPLPPRFGTGRAPSNAHTTRSGPAP